MMKASKILWSICLVCCVATSLASEDQYEKLYSNLKAKYKAGTSSPEYWKLREKASAKNATANDRFTLAAVTIVGKGGYLAPHRLSEFRKHAYSLLKDSDIKISPMFGYLFAYLGLFTPVEGKNNLVGAKAFYNYRKDGKSAYYLARTMINDSSSKVRSASLPYAEYAKSQLPDSLSIRWMYAGSLFEVADVSKKKSDWQKAVQAYDNALKLATADGDKSILSHYLKLAKEEQAKAKA
jgi:hypothetical protein